MGEEYKRFSEIGSEGSLTAQYVENDIRWNQTTENDQHCFKDNPNNKEIVTVNEFGTPYFVLKHFHQRLSSIGSQLKSKSLSKEGFTTITIYEPKVLAFDDVEFELEMKSCIIESGGGLFKTNEITYTSYRLKD